jgi:hypothetical protein
MIWAAAAFAGKRIAVPANVGENFRYRIAVQTLVFIDGHKIFLSIIY